MRLRLLWAWAAGMGAALTTAPRALAAPPLAADVAQNLADQLTHWATLIIVPIAAIMALPALFRRDVGHAMVILVIVLIVGAFAFNPAGVQDFVRTVSNAVLG